jgi:inorganic pyrophosphatase/K(+)-stimulated pyrophosphate-energized sodium pump
MLFIAFRGFHPRPAVIFLQVMVMDFLLAGVSLGQVPTETQEAASSVMASASSGSAEPAAIEWFYWAILLAASLTALGFAFSFFRKMKEADPGNDRMVEIANYVTVGAKAYLKQQYLVVSIYFTIVFLLLWWARNAGIQQYWVPIAFLTGGFWSGLAGYIGMTTATAASSRTAAGAMKSLNDGLQVAFRSGAVMGLTVVGLGTLDMAIWYGILRFICHLDLNTITVTMLCSLMGASSQALFARVGGGIFTKAADVGADLVGKVEQGIPEDDPRNPATIADNVGDNVGDVAGMGADLYESYCGSILATAALGVAAMATIKLPGESVDATSWQIAALFLPLMVAAIGIVMSIACIFLVKADDDASQKALLKVLGRGIDGSMVLTFIGSAIATWLLLGTSFIGIVGSIATGLFAGWAIGKWTEYVTSDEYKPTQKLADQAQTGAATVIIGGVADGMKSVWFPVIIVCVGMLLAFGFATSFEFDDPGVFTLGLYGVGISAVGMLSTLGITLATDAYGPIADNAGGNAQMSELDAIVRERTDALDSLGNTTAATGKGFAIGSAALTALALLAAYVEQVKTGYENWARSADVAGVFSEADTFYQLNKNFIARKSESGDVAGYLLMPEYVRKPVVADVWNAADTYPIKLDSELFETDEDGARIAVTQDPLIRVNLATMPDIARLYNATLLNPRVLIGVFLGCMTTFVFCAMTMKAVGRAAFGMVEEVRRQFKEDSGIMAGTSKPDYARPVAISTRAAQCEMILPSLMGILTPIVVGLLLGVGGVIGLLVGTLCCGFCVAIFMANSGGSWDNAKKYVEAGHLGGKGSDAHKAAVVGDTVGDPFKDTCGPSLNILIKLMSIVSVVAAGMVVRYSLVAIGWL